MALDAIATPVLVEEIPFTGKILWCITGYDTDASTAIEIKAAPGENKALYLTSIILQSNDADANPHLQDGDATVLIGPLMSSTGGQILSHTFSKPLKLTNNKSLQLKAAAAGNVFVHVEGAIAAG